MPDDVPTYSSRGLSRAALPRSQRTPQFAPPSLRPGFSGTTGVNKMLLTIAAILFILWILGFSLHVGGGIIHALLVIALIVAIFHFVTGRRVVG